MAANQSALADPADGAFDDWFELHNPGPLPVPIAGFWLSDDPATPAKSIVPQGFHVPPGGYLLVWADEQPDQSQPGGDLHVDFRLRLEGEQIQLSDATGRLVDAVRFERQDADRSEGRWPDAVPAPFYAMSPATPRASNRIAASDWPEIHIRDVQVDPSLGVTLTWDALPGRTYRVRASDQLATGSWTDLVPDVQAAGHTASLLDPSTGPGAQRYYQVMLLAP